MNKLLFLIISLSSRLVFSCNCLPVQPITKELCNGYNVIFHGKVDSVGSSLENNMSIVYFTIEELYKGKCQQQVKVFFESASDCMMSFTKNEEWLMYCNYQRFDELNTNICGHSRKKFKPGEQDFYQLAAQRSFDEEKLFLASTLSIQPFTKENELYKQQTDFKPHNTQPEGINKLLLLLASFIVMTAIFLITRKKDKTE